MKKLFPVMFEKPETRTTITGIAYWFFAFLVLPFVIGLFSMDAGQELYGAWLNMGYHILNFVVVIACFLPYLRDTFLTVQIDTKKFLKTVVVGVVAVVALKILITKFFEYTLNELYFHASFGHFVTTEMDLAYYSTALLYEQPVFGTLCVVLLTPVTTSCLLYACSFAPICCRRPWLAYIVMTVISLILRMMMIFCFWSSDQQIAGFWVQLPIHLVACWTYQHTDTVWAPIAVHSISNLLLSLLALFYMGII